MTIIIFIIVLAVIVLVHEVGHFLLAKLCGVKVEEFGLGLPPRVWGKKIGETLYSINWIPVGGFVRMLGEDLSDNEKISDSEKTRSFSHKSKWKQALVLVAGITFNIIFAWLVISFCLYIGMPAPVGQSSFAETENVQTVITEVLPGSPAASSGLVSGDSIVSVAVDGKSIANPTAEKISKAISQSKIGDVTIVYKKGNDTKTVTITPDSNLIKGKRLIGVSMDNIGTLRLSPLPAVLEGARTTYLLTISTARGLFDFLHKTIVGKSNLAEVSGPIGIARVVGQATNLGFVYLLSLVALISINLALINLIPFPALDGGRLLFVLIESITRQKIPPKVAGWINTAGFILLIFLMLFISIHDIFNLLK
jgi:regulator of sigma E protease